ncbi:MAG TPA: hypothetical protein VFQ88_08220 [Nevskiaceae bacterium]|nr:hypothetical protein [Nevskiaceae bacterium]
MDRRHAPLVTQALEVLNPALAHDVIDSGTGPALALALRQVMNEKGIAGIMADRLAGADPGLPAPFMGGTAWLPEAPWRWAAALGAPVLLCFGLYRGGNRYDLHFELFSDAHLPIPRADRAKYVQDCVERYAARLEVYARMAPYNWFNFYDFWTDEASGN